MSESITQQGILVHVDLADSCRQGDRIGLVSTDEFYRWLEGQLRQRFAPHGFEFVKSMGDACLFFGQDPQQIPPLVLDLFTRQPIPKRFGFRVELRAVAGSGWFQLRAGTERKYVDAIGPEVNKIFRLDKHGKPDHFLVRADLRDPIAHLLPQWGIEEEEVVAPPLKGFEKHGSVLCFLLKPPSIGLSREELPAPYQDAREALRLSSLKIPVLGGLARDMAMESDFIQLTVEEIAPEEAKTLTAEELFSQRGQGLIFGPPGSGKTTMLRQYAFQTLRKNPEAFVIFARGSDLALEDVPSRDASAMEVWEALAGAFIFPRRAKAMRRAEEQELVAATARFFQEAWEQGLVVLLIDGLDEITDGTAPGPAQSHLIKLARRLFDETAGDTGHASRRSANKLFVSMPASEERNLELRGMPSFRVKDLALEEIASLAANIFRVTPEFSQPFRQAMARDAAALLVAATPLTATLAIIYFQHYQALPLRYRAYDLMMRFLLGNVRRNLETETTRWTSPADLVEEISSTGFITRTTELRLYYDAVSALCYEELYVRPQRTADQAIADRVCLDFFAAHLAAAAEWDETKAAEEARALFDRLCAQHLLAPYRPGAHAFVHAYCVEFLAARRLANLVSDKEAFAAAVQRAAQADGAEKFETLPLLCGYKAEIGYEALEALRALPAPGGMESSLPFRCAAEAAAAAAKMNVGSFHNEPDVKRAQAVHQWIRECVVRLIMKSEAGALRQWAENYHSALPMSLEDFPESMRSMWERGAAELVEARRAALEKLFSPGAIASLKTPSAAKISTTAPTAPAGAASTPAPGETLLTLDLPGSRDDKNFAYHARRLGAGLLGFFGSPNLLQSVAVRAVSVAPGGAWIASGGVNGSLRIWDALTGREILAPQKHTGPVEACAWSPDEAALLTASSDGTAVIWDMPAATVRHTLTGHGGAVNACAWSPDGLFVATASADKTAQIWDALTGKPTLKLTGHQAAVASCAWSPDGKLIASGSWDQTLRIWSAQSGAALATISGASTVKSCSWSPDSKKIASVSDKSIRVHELPGGREYLNLTGHKSLVNACSWSMDGKFLASASADQTIKIWEVEAAAEVLTLQGHRGGVDGCAWSADGSFVVSGSSDASVKIWDLPAGKERFQFSGHRNAATSCAWSPDGATLVSSARDQTLKLWAVPAGTESATLSGHKGSVDTCAWAKDGSAIASGARDNTIKIWSMPDAKELVTLMGHTGRILACAWSPKDNMLASASWDNSVRLWETTWGKQVRVLTGHQDAVFTCAWSPDGALLATGSNDRSLKLWDPASDKPLNSWTKHQGAIECCAWSPDGKKLVTGAGDGVLKIWKMPDGATLVELAGHKGSILTCAWCAQGNLLVSGSQDQTIKIWDLARGTELLAIALGWTPRHIRFSPARPYEFAVAGETGVVALFDARRALEPR